MRALDKHASKGMKEKQDLDDWDVEMSVDWEAAQVPCGGLGRGYSTLTKRLDQVRGGHWGMSPEKKKPSSLRDENI
jgi:hypothetical protein